MAKQITFEYDGTSYTLEYSKRVIEQMEIDGFRINDLGDMPYTMVRKLISGAFKKHHPTLAEDKIEVIYSEITDKQGFVGALAELYGEHLNALVAEPKKSTKNVKWTMKG